MRCYLACCLANRSPGLPRTRRIAEIFSPAEIAHRQHVHLRAPETIQRLFRAADDRLVVVEGCIQHDGHARQIANRAQKFPIERIRVAAHGLQARGAVHVRGRGNHGALFRAHRIGKSHERRRMRLLEKFAGGLLGNRRRKRAEDLAMLDAAVQNVLHFRRGADRPECCGCQARAAPIPPPPETSRRFFRRRCGARWSAAEPASSQFRRCRIVASESKPSNGLANLVGENSGPQ